VPPGFATTSHAYWDYIDKDGIRTKIAGLVAEWQSGKASLAETGYAVRRLFLRQLAGGCSRQEERRQDDQDGC
jgi:pyruvate,water dikinase